MHIPFDSPIRQRQAHRQPLCVVLLTNEPPPYRVPVFNRIANMPGIAFHVIFCCRREPNRCWNLPPFAFAHTFLRERFYTVRGRYIHNNPDVVLALRRLQPDVVVNDGMNPTQLYAFLYCHLRRIAHVPLTDGTDVSEAALSALHVFLRRMVYRRSAAFLAASQGGVRLFARYGVPASRCHFSPLCADNAAFLVREAIPFAAREGDLVFSGRMVAGKNPAFALDVAEGVARRLGRRVRLLMLGSGELEPALRAQAAGMADRVTVDFAGFARQEELPRLYANGKVFLFPTAADVWGVVANEACAAGLPTLISPHAGAANELVVDGVNGFVRPLTLEQWVDAAVTLLTDAGLWQRFSEAALRAVSAYSYEQAANGIVDAAVAARRHAGSDLAGDAFPAA